MLANGVVGVLSRNNDCRNKSGFAFGHFPIHFPFLDAGRMGASSARISDTCVGDSPFLCSQDACYFTRTPESPHHLRSVSFFEKPTLSRWKCVYFHWSGADLRVANGPHRYRYSHSPDRSFYTARRTTIRTSIR